MISPSETPDAAHAEKLPAFSDDLVFILGCHRSGTTFLHQALVETELFRYISAYDIIHYDSLLENRITGKEDAARKELDTWLASVANDRGIDHCAIGAREPEEFGFILPKDPQRFLFSPQVTPDNDARFMEMCCKNAFLYGNNRPLLLKNPDDFYGNFVPMSERYQAKFLFVHRHPLMVLNSQIRAWRSMLDKPNEYFARMHAGYRALLKDAKGRIEKRTLLTMPAGIQWMFSEFIKSYRYYCDNIPKIAPERRLIIRYEDLCREPAPVLSQACAFAGVGNFPSSIQPKSNPRKPQILPEVANVYEAMRPSVQFYLEALGYGEMPDELS